jgi:hypothetical protein
MAQYKKELLDLVPPEFCINNYKNSAQFSSQDWFMAICKRGAVNAWLSEGNIDRARNRSIENIREGAAELIHIVEYYGGTGVDDFDIEHYDSYHQGTIGSDCFAVVDLKVPDDLLVTSFLTWVENKRLERGVKATNKVITPAKSRQWHDARILQYMDVTQWHRINNLNPTSGQIGLILYPDDNRGAVAERLRVVKKHIVELSSKGYMNTLFSTPPDIYRDEKL